jgi:hypothetical protein
MHHLFTPPRPPNAIPLISSRMTSIPERADDVEESPSSSTIREGIRKSTAATTDKPPRDKESSKRGSRRDSRPTCRCEHHEPTRLPPRSFSSSSAELEIRTRLGLNDDAIRNVCQLIFRFISCLWPAHSYLSGVRLEVILCVKVSVTVL